jgi:hypothetical protein
MLRLIAVIAASLLAASCTSNKPEGAGGGAGTAAGGAARGSGSGSSGGKAAASARPAPTTTLEQVQRSAPAGTRAAPAGIAVPGIELFALTDATPAEDADYTAGTLVGVVGGVGGTLVEGTDLLRAVAQARPDRKTLARIAAWAAQREGEILDKASTAEQRKARVAGPAIKGTTLTFWLWTTETPRSLEKGTLELTTGNLELAPPAMPREAAIARALATLAGPSVSRHPAAIKALVALCSDARARQAVLSMLANHPRDRTRAAVADEVHKCGAPAVEPLINLMERDRSAMVRTQAALALGRTGDARARPALAKASRGDDANLVWAAKSSLGKLK